MATNRWRRAIDLERGVDTISEFQTQKVMQKIRAACREPSRHEPPEPAPRISLSAGWDRKAGKPIVR